MPGGPQQRPQLNHCGSRTKGWFSMSLNSFIVIYLGLRLLTTSSEWRSWLCYYSESAVGAAFEIVNYVFWVFSIYIRLIIITFSKQALVVICPHTFGKRHDGMVKDLIENFRSIDDTAIIIGGGTHISNCSSLKLDSFHTRRKTKTRSSAIAEWQRDASCQ